MKFQESTNKLLGLEAQRLTGIRRLLICVYIFPLFVFTQEIKIDESFYETTLHPSSFATTNYKFFLNHKDKSFRYVIQSHIFKVELNGRWILTNDTLSLLIPKDTVSFIRKIEIYPDNEFMRKGCNIAMKYNNGNYELINRIIVNGKEYFNDGFKYLNEKEYEEYISIDCQEIKSIGFLNDDIGNDTILNFEKPILDRNLTVNILTNREPSYLYEIAIIRKWRIEGNSIIPILE